MLNPSGAESVGYLLPMILAKTTMLGRFLTLEQHCAPPTRHARQGGDEDDARGHVAWARGHVRRGRGGGSRGRRHFFFRACVLGIFFGFLSRCAARPGCNDRMWGGCHAMIGGSLPPGLETSFFPPAVMTNISSPTTSPVYNASRPPRRRLCRIVPTAKILGGR